MRGSQEPGGLILIVEDNRNISEMVGEYLEGRGFEVDYAADGLDGYRLASENSYDVIVLDLMLPGLDGYGVLEALRSDRSTPGVKVLVLSAKSLQADRDRSRQLGAEAFLTKPFLPDDLCRTVDRILGLEG
jgi:DNA-binding response OmpR family regulator